MPFSSFGFHPCVQRALRELSFERPTPIQQQAMPPALEGRDLAPDLTGMAPNANLYDVKVLNDLGFGTLSDTLEGIQWVIHNAKALNIRVLNLSLGGPDSCSAAYADAVSQINALGVVIVASAGNGRGLAVSEPANCAGVIGVGGVRHEGDKVGYSDIGPELSLSAPAGNCVNVNAGEPCLYPILTTANFGLFDPVTGNEVRRV